MRVIKINLQEKVLGNHFLVRVEMQDSDPGLPGYYQERKMEVVTDVLEEDEGEEDFFSDENEDEIDGSFEDGDGEVVKAKSKDGIDWDSEEWDSDFDDDDDDDDAEELDGFTAASVGYVNITEETVEKRKRKRVSKSERKKNVGQTVHVGGLMRLDLSQASVQTIYVSIWASPNVSLHMGKTENANDTWSKHAGVRLQPPISADRVPELGEWKATEVKVSGTS